MLWGSVQGFLSPTPPITPGAAYMHQWTGSSLVQVSLSPVRHQAIAWTNAEVLWIGLLGTNFSEIWIGIPSYSFKKMHLKMSSANIATILSRRRWGNSNGLWLVVLSHPIHLSTGGTCTWRSMTNIYFFHQRIPKFGNFQCTSGICDRPCLWKCVIRHTSDCQFVFWVILAYGRCGSDHPFTVSNAFAAPCFSSCRCLPWWGASWVS